MPQAPIYNRSKNFAENNPDRTDHTQLNAELDKVASSINALRTNAALLQNDDGTLKNAIVTLASLSPDLVQSLAGPAGPAGATGSVGPAGPVGVTGDKGDTGASFSADARDVLVNRSLYDLQPKGFSMLAMDTGMLYFKLSAVSGHWSSGAEFGKGETGGIGPQGPQGLPGIQGLQGPPGESLLGPAGADGLVSSVDLSTKTASLIGRSSVNARLVVTGGQLSIVLTTS